MMTIEREELRSLAGAVEAGTGLARLSRPDGRQLLRGEPEYQFIVGGQWVAHPGNIIDYAVDIVRNDDPVMQGIGRFAYRSEQYYMHVDPSNEVLATTTFDGTHCAWIEGVTMPVVWKRRHGEGRVFYSALGHVASEFSHPDMSRIISPAAWAWAARS